MTDDSASFALVDLVRASGRDVLATLARTTGDLALAEDAVQDAVVRALEVWPRDGVPANPVAWLRLVARRRAVDLIRREAARLGKESAAMEYTVAAESGEPLPPSVVEDDLLRLVFTCCHPSLSAETQVSLALRTLCGLTTAEVARALLVPEATMAKRLTRARQKIRQAGIAYRVPRDHELPGRWATVLATAYLLFNEGYAATSGDDLVRTELSDEAIRLARLLVRLRPDDVGALGLLALMLLQDSRREERSDANDGTLLLAEQDRSRWDATKIGEAVPLVGEALQRSPNHPDRYVVQAAIVSCHALAPSYDETDWAAIVSWYDVLVTLDPGPVVQLNRAVAVGERDGPAVALALVESVPGLQTYALWHATRAALLRRLGREGDAREATMRAAALPLSRPQLQFLRSAQFGDTGAAPDTAAQPHSSR